MQVIGLFGREGILPLAARLEALDAHGYGFTDLPTLLWLTGAADAQLHLLCLLGEVASIALLLGIVPLFSSLACYALYLSFVSVGSPFIPLQWDALLLEACLVVALVSPARFAHPDYEPPRLARFAIVFLVARLVFASGLVKLLSGDPMWRELTAMTVHYETQPLPGPLSRLVHLLPAPFHRLETGLALAIEIATPLFAFGPRLGRRAFAIAVIALMALIALTGNYGFFNLLTASLALACLDDAAFASVKLRFIPSLGPFRFWASPPGPGLPSQEGEVTSRRVRSGVACASIAMGATCLLSSLGLGSDALQSLLAPVAPFELASRYGLFAVMTPDRPELVFEASEDGITWRPYELRYKPGNVERTPGLIGPHMPRVDWMLWFAALGPPDGARWVFALEDAMLEGREPVLAFFGEVPLRRPRFLRCLRYSYRFAPAGADAVWVRDEPHPWGPTRERR